MKWENITKMKEEIRTKRCQISENKKRTNALGQKKGGDKIITKENGGRISSLFICNHFYVCFQKRSSNKLIS